MEARQSKISLAGSSGRARLVVPEPGEPPLLLDLQLDAAEPEWAAPLLLDLDLGPYEIQALEALDLDLTLEPVPGPEAESLVLEIALAPDDHPAAPLMLELTLSV